MHEFSNKPWSASGFDKLIRKLTIEEVQSTDFTNGRGMLKSLNQKIVHVTALT